MKIHMRFGCFCFSCFRYFGRQGDRNGFRWLCLLSVLLFGLGGFQGLAVTTVSASQVAFLEAESCVSAQQNRLDKIAPKPFGSGFQVQTEEASTVWFCEAGEKPAAHGVSFSIDLNQKRPIPIFVSAESRSAGADLKVSPNYSIYLDLVYMDDSVQWGVIAMFTGSETWEKKSLTFVPTKPIKHVSMYLMFRETPGKAWFRAPVFAELCSENGSAHLFDGTLVQPTKETQSDAGCRFTLTNPKAVSTSQPESDEARQVSPTTGCFYLHDLSAEQPQWLFLEAQDGGCYEAAGISVERTTLPTPCPSAEVDVLRVRSKSREDRCVTLVYALRNADVTARLEQAESHSIPVFAALDEAMEVSPDGNQEASHAKNTTAGMKRLSDIPVLAVPGRSGRLYGLGIDLEFPAVHRLFFNAVTQEWCIAYDLAFTEDQPEWELRCVRFCLEPDDSCHASRRVWEAFMQAFPETFALRLPKDPKTGRPIHGNWMPFAKISPVPNSEDFAFRFKEGGNETAWDDAHGVLTFRYTEPMTWWWNFEPDEKDGAASLFQQAMNRLEKDVQSGNQQALIWKNSVMYDQHQRPYGLEQRTPWCKHGIVWSMNSVPGVAEPSDFSSKWNDDVKKALYAGNRQWKPEEPSGLDGEYIDSSEGYVTIEMDYRREHFKTVKTPLTFDSDTKQPVVFRGLVAFEYIRGLARDVHGGGRWMMGNATPNRISWLAGQLDVMGTESDWNYQNRWQPMSVQELRLRRMLCGGKPFCFLMNTDFTKFTHEHVEKYMKRALAFGMFPGFFSADASTGHYFEQPKLYERDRSLFRKYLPICRLLSESGWQVNPRASVSDERVCLERFGEGPSYLTLFNPTDQPVTFTLRLPTGKIERVLLGEAKLPADASGEVPLTLETEDVLVLEVTGE